MFARTETMALNGLAAERVSVEVNVGHGLPYFVITGGGDAALKGMAERVRCGMVNSGFRCPQGRVTVNLAPAYIKKKGTHYDLAAAVGLLAADGQITGAQDGRLLFGELSMDGRVLPVKGLLPMILGAVRSGKKYDEVLTPRENCAECHVAAGPAGVSVVPISTLREAAEHLNGSPQPPYVPPPAAAGGGAAAADFADVKGQEAAKTAIAVAMAGAHSILLVGPPGAGKTMLAGRAPGILPPMSAAEALETAAIYSLAGLFSEQWPCGYARPLRRVTGSATLSVLLGGGARLVPGEVSLAHNGVLLADELPELPPKLLGGLRSVLEERKVAVRAGDESSFLPADFILVGTANPCRCGFYGDPRRRCTCTAGELAAYRRRLPGPLADRIDISLDVGRINYEELSRAEATDSRTLRERVTAARSVQRKRYEGLPFKLNGQMDDAYIERFCKLGDTESEFLRAFYERFAMSTRRCRKILKIARTIADMEESEKINTEHLAAAVHYTRLPSGEDVYNMKEIN